MSRDNYYSQLSNESTGRPPKITDMDGLLSVLADDPYPSADEDAAFGETRDDSTYPITVHKTLKGFQYYGDETYVIPSLGFDPNFENESFIEFWAPISEHTEPFTFWLRNGLSLPIEFRPEHIDDEEEIYHISFANGELVEAEQYTLGILHTEDVTPNTP